MRPRSVAWKSLSSAASTSADSLPGTSKPPPVRFSVCLAAKGRETARTTTQAASTAQRRRVRKSDRSTMNDFKDPLPVARNWLAGQYAESARALRL